MIWLINYLISHHSKTCPRRPPANVHATSIRKLVWVCEHRDKKNPNIEFTFNDIDEKILSASVLPLLDYVNHRYDCSDFRVIQLLKLKFIGQDLLDRYPEINQKIKESLLGFKFWITELGNDSMCYYSENHQMCFIACEYLIGKLYPDEIFTNDHKNGLEHQKIALERFNAWIELRSKYSYSEFYSSNYIPISLTALTFLYQYSDSNEIKRKCKKEIHTILRFFATNAFEDTWINASGRDYPRNVMNCSYDEPHSKTIIDNIWGDGNFAYNNYSSAESIFTYCYLKDKSLQIPDEIKNLYYEDETITKRRFSLDVSNYAREGLDNNSTKSLMMRLGSGVLTNPGVFNLTIKLLKNHKQLYHNNFLYWVRSFYSPLLYKLGLMDKLSKKFNFYNNRMGIEESNVYTYRNKYFKMSTNQAHHMNKLGAQMNTMVVTLPKGITVFTMHPSYENDNPKIDYSRAPSYFASFCFAPFAVQDKNVAMLIYDIPKRTHAFLYENKLFGSFTKTLDYTHTFFPTELFDEYTVEGRYAFARVKDSYLALIAKNELFLKRNSEYVINATQGMLKDINKSFDLVQPGRNTYWIYELSCKKDESFEEFKNRIKNNKVNFNHLSLEYISKHNYKINNVKDFLIDNSNINLRYEYDVK
ncbi:MAG: hypothetical protein MJ214_02300 [Bacilli bacterium]|nr:hypothetical protein [Bacilli bacterium]